METFYLVDFENVKNEGIEKIALLTQTDHVHIFYTKNAQNIRKIPKGIDCKKHKVPDGKESLDMHLVSYLGYLLGNHRKNVEYIIISEDKDYDNIIKFWQKAGYSNISKKRTIQGAFSGDDRTKLNQFMQRKLADMGYSKEVVNRICKYTIAHCNDEKIFKGIGKDLNKIYTNDIEVCNDVKTIFEDFNPRE